MPGCTLMNMCLINDGAGRVLVQDKIHARWPGITFPGGHVDDGESVYDSAVREVKEETGLTVYDLHQAGLIHMYDPETRERRMIFLFKASRCEGEAVEGTEEGRVFWAPLADLETMRLAPNMREYLKVFLDDGINEAFVTRDGGYKFYSY